MIPYRLCAVLISCSLINGVVTNGQEILSAQEATSPDPALEALEGSEGGEMTALDVMRYEELQQRRVYQLTNMDLAEYLDLKRASQRNPPDVQQEAEMWLARSLGQPYRLNALQFDLGEGDCVSFVNQTLALSLASDYRSYSVIVERLRHADGVVHYRNRNFFTLGDWVPNNAWLLDDVTYGFAAAKTFTHVVRPKVFEERPAAPGSKYTRIIFKGSDYRSKNQRIIQDAYVPAQDVAAILPDLRTGDVVLILRAASGGHLGCDHLGMIVSEIHGPKLVHSAPPHVLQEDLLSFLGRCNWVVGLKFLRLKSDARELAAQEISRLGEGVTVLSAAARDEQVVRLREGRAAASE